MRTIWDDSICVVTLDGDCEYDFDDCVACPVYQHLYDEQGELPWEEVRNVKYTDTHKLIVAFIGDYQATHGYMPNTVEIANEVDVTTNTVASHMVRLAKQDLIETDLVMHNELGECSRTAWMTRGYRFGKRWNDGKNY